VLHCRVICGNECRSYLLQHLYSVPHSAAQEETVSLLPRSHTVTGGAVQLLLASICIPFAFTPISARAPAGMRAAQQRHNRCLQAPNVSLQQLIASFAAQSRQLGLQPSPRVSTADHDSISGADQHDTSTSTVLPDPDALTASRWVTFSNCYGRCLQQKLYRSTG